MTTPEQDTKRTTGTAYHTGERRIEPPESIQPHHLILIALFVTAGMGCIWIVVTELFQLIGG